ncbi:MAG: serine hydrolase [Planctomycetota bacterium]
MTGFSPRPQFSTAKYPGSAFPLQAAIPRSPRVVPYPSRRAIIKHIALLLAIVLPTILPAWSILPAWQPTATAAETWQEKLTDLIARHPGEVAVAVKDLRDGESFACRADDPMPTASLIKFPVMVEAYRQAAAGQLSLATPVVVRDEDKVPGSGILTTHFSAGATFSLRDAIRLMIAWSDNTATNLVVDRVGIASTSRFMKELGCPETQLHSKVFLRDTSIAPERSRQFGLGSTTANEMVHLLERLHRRELIDAAASDAMLDHLRACQDHTTLPSGLPSTIHIAHKTGAVTGVRTDAGLVELPGRTIAICVLTRKNRVGAGVVGDPGERLCGEIARVVYEQFRPTVSAKPSAPGEPSDTLKLGDSGEHVRQLQIRLNALFRPVDKTPNSTWEPLDEDGEFGPLTKAAVERWQKREKRPATGKVTAEEGRLIAGER